MNKEYELYYAFIKYDLNKIKKLIHDGVNLNDNINVKSFGFNETINPYKIFTITLNNPFNIEWVKINNYLNMINNLYKYTLNKLSHIYNLNDDVKFYIFSFLKFK